MKLKMIGFSCFAWVFSVFLSASPAKAYLSLPLQDVTKVSVTGKFRAEVSTFCGRTFNYRQLIAIPGYGGVWALVDTIYSSGSNEATLVEECVENGETHYIYELGDCGC